MRFLLIPLLLFFFLSLGPLIQFEGAALATGYPYLLFSSLLPFFPSVPARFSIVVILFLLAFVAQTLTGSANKAIFGILFALLIFEYWPAGLKSMSIEPSPALEALAQDSSIHSVHDTSKVLQYPMLRQIYHHKNITNAFLSRRPKKPLMEYRKNPFMRYLSGTEEPSADKILDGFKRLKLDGLIVEKEQLQTLARAERLPFLKQKYADDKVIIYSAPMSQ